MEKTLKLIKGALISAVIFVVMSLVFGVLLATTEIPERYAGFYLIMALSTACAFMGLYTGNLFAKNGLFSGIVFSAVLSGFILSVAALCFSASISTSVLSFQHLIQLAFGGIFGIIGTNLKNDL
jgi:putative membrane protein (TIGR04086 family)